MLESFLLSENSVAYETNKKKFLSSTKSYYISVYNLLIIETVQRACEQNALS